MEELLLYRKVIGNGVRYPMTRSAVMQRKIAGRKAGTNPSATLAARLVRREKRVFSYR
jgi:hypothetical protein